MKFGFVVLLLSLCCVSATPSIDDEGATNGFLVVFDNLTPSNLVLHANSGSAPGALLPSGRRTVVKFPSVPGILHLDLPGGVSIISPSYSPELSLVATFTVVYGDGIMTFDSISIHLEQFDLTNRETRSAARRVDFSTRLTFVFLALIMGMLLFISYKKGRSGT